MQRGHDVPGAGTLHFDLCPTDSGQAEELGRLLSLGATPTDVVPSFREIRAH